MGGKFIQDAEAEDKQNLVSIEPYTLPETAQQAYNKVNLYIGIR